MHCECRSFGRNPAFCRGFRRWSKTVADVWRPVLPHGKNHLVEGSCGKIIFSVIPSWPLFTQSGAEPLPFAKLLGYVSK